MGKDIDLRKLKYDIDDTQGQDINEVKKSDDEFGKVKSTMLVVNRHRNYLRKTENKLAKQVEDTKKKIESTLNKLDEVDYYSEELIELATKLKLNVRLYKQLEEQRRQVQSFNSKNFK